MKIETLSIRSFGKMKNFELSGAPHLQVIYGENESGKSTVLDFILLAFYVGYSRKRDVRNNPRLRYRFKEADDGGVIVFTSGNRKYRLSHQFASAAGQDTVTLQDEHTGELISLPAGQTPGDYFFGMDINAFLRTLFIDAQGNLVQKPNGSDTLKDRLLSAVSTGDVSVSYDVTKKRLEEAKKTLVSLRGNTGRLNDLDQHIAALEEQFITARAAEHERKEAEEQIAIWSSARAEKVAQLERCQRRRTQLAQEQEGRRLQQALENARELERLTATRAQRAQKLQYPGGVLTREGLERWQQVLEEWKDAERGRRQAAARQAAAQEEREAHKATGQSAPQARLEQAKEALANAEQDVAQKKQRLEFLGANRSESRNRINTADAQREKIREQLQEQESALWKCEEELRALERNRPATFVESIVPAPKRSLPILLSGGMLMLFFGIAFYLEFLPKIPAGLLFGGSALLTLLGFYRAKKAQSDWEMQRREESKRQETARQQQAAWETEVRKQQEAQASARQVREQTAQILQEKERECESARKDSEECNQKYSVAERALHEAQTAVALCERDCTDAARNLEEDLQQGERIAQTIEASTVDLEKWDMTIADHAARFETFFGKNAPQNSAAGTEFLQDVGRAVRDWEDASRDVTLLAERLQQADGTSVAELEERWATWKQRFDASVAQEEDCIAAPPNLPAEEMQADLDRTIDVLHQEVANLRGKIVERTAEINTKFKDTPNVSQLEAEKASYLAEREHLCIQADALSLALETLEASYKHTRSGISVKLNERTGEILRQLTGGHYERVWVDGNYGITVESAEQASRPWDMLSSGTMEQAYFALRIAMTELIQSEEIFPLFLDDSFVLFDDQRAERALHFLQTYAAEQNRQIFLFTCHGRMKRLAQAEGVAWTAMAE